MRRPMEVQVNSAHLSSLRAAKTKRTIDIIRRYTIGEPVAEIASRYGLHRTAISKIARDAGIPKRSRHFPDRIRNGVLRDYKAKIPIAKIADKWNVSQSYVSTLATKHGINRHRQRE